MMTYISIIVVLLAALCHYEVKAAVDCRDMLTVCKYIDNSNHQCGDYRWTKYCKATCPPLECRTNPTTTTTRKPTTTTRTPRTTTTTTRKPTTKTTTTTRKPTTTTTRKTTTTTTTRTPRTTTTTTTKKPTTTRRTTTITIPPNTACGDKMYWCHVVASNTGKYCGLHAKDCIRSCNVCTGPTNEKCANLKNEPGYDCVNANCNDSNKTDQSRAKRWCARKCCLQN